LLVKFTYYARSLLGPSRGGSGKERAMYTVIRTYDLIPGMKEEFIQRVQKSLVPILYHVPGCRDYTLLEAGDNQVAVISTFTTFADAKASAQMTGDWLSEHTALFIEGYSKIAAGQVRVQSEPACLSPTSSEELLQGCF
jgi:antibiotic biosynthesis monooxygenase